MQLHFNALTFVIVDKQLCIVKRHEVHNMGKKAPCSVHAQRGKWTNKQKPIRKSAHFFFKYNKMALKKRKAKQSRKSIMNVIQIYQLPKNWTHALKRSS